VPAQRWDDSLGIREWTLLVLGVGLVVVCLPPAYAGLLLGTALACFAVGESHLRRRGRLVYLAILVAGFLFLQDRALIRHSGVVNLRVVGGVFLLRCLDFGLTQRTDAGRPLRQRLARYLLWMFFIPTLICPTVSYVDFYDSYRPRVRNRGAIWRANLLRIALGVGKFFAFAQLIEEHVSDRLLEAAVVTNPGARLLAASAFLVDLLCFYFCLSGFCEVTVALSRLLGFHLYDNFNYALLARTPADYRKNSNISVYRWLTTHVFLPCWGPRRLVAKVLTAFLVSLLWHCAMLTPANWQGMLQIAIAFAVWAPVVAVQAVFFRPKFGGRPARSGRRGWSARLRTAGQVVLTFCFVLVLHKVFWNGWLGRPIEQTVDAYRLLLLGSR
jgi:D-alanyl-lipoteichoic acid acyltransferase DltB (MBOAT superfamily)